MSSTRVFAALGLVLLAVASACDETTAPPPPASPPQLQTLTSYSYGSTGLTSNDVYAFLALSNGEFWVGGASGIAKFPNAQTAARDADAYVSEITGLPNSKVRAMVEYEGKVYVGTWGGGVGVYNLVDSTWSSIQKKTNGLRNNSIADIAVSPTENRIYFATNDGVSIYDPTAHTFTSFIPPALLDRMVSSVQVSVFGGTVERWYGPRFEEKLTVAQLPKHGITVSRTPGTPFSMTTLNSGLLEPNVNDIFYDADRQTYWVAYASRGIAEVNPALKTWTTNTTVHGLPSNTVYAVTRAGGTIWAATQNGLAKRLGDNHWQGYNRGGGLQADRARAVYSPDGVSLYVGFVDGGAARVKTN